MDRTERVRAGKAFLDEKVPGWEQYIDPNELDLTDCYNCVIGQLAERMNWQRGIGDSDTLHLIGV